MTKKGLRGISIGLFIATLILAYIYFFQSIEAETMEREEEVPQLSLSSEEMMLHLEQQGFIVLEEEEYNLLLKTKVDSDEHEVELEEVPHYAIVTVESGMTSTDVAKKLEEAQIIESHEDFIAYLIEHQLAYIINVGEYHLTSDMTFEQLGVILTEEEKAEEVSLQLSNK